MNAATVLLAVSVVSAVVAVASALAVPILIARLPEDHFCRPPPPRRWPALRAAAGVVLIAAGVIMLFTPGQGVLSILAGLSLIDFPGRRRILTRILRRPAVQRAITAIRARAQQPPLTIPQEEDSH